MATKVSEDVSEVWVTYKQDQTNQELRNRLMSGICRWSDTTLNGCAGRNSPKALT